jgi:drug/metabolite transporter (DMT)-like permease
LTKRDTFTGICFATLATIIWSGNFIIARYLFEKIPPVSLAFYRWATALIILIPFSYKSFIAEWRIVKQSLVYLFWTSLTGISLFNTLIYVGAHHTTAVNLSLIGTTTTPLFAIILARIFLDEKIGLSKTFGMIVCITGILYLLSKGNLHNLIHLKFSEGDLWALAAAISFSVYTTMVKKKPAGISTINFLFTSFLLGTLLLIPFFIRELVHTSPVKWDGEIGASVIYLGLGASVICFLAWNMAIHKLGAGRTALFGNLIPVFSSIEALFILNEQFNLYHIISMILVFAGLLIANLKSVSINKRTAGPRDPAA